MLAADDDDDDNDENCYDPVYDFLAKNPVANSVLMSWYENQGANQQSKIILSGIRRYFRSQSSGIITLQQEGQADR